MFELVSKPKAIKTKVEFKYPTDNGEVKKTFFAFFLMVSVERYNELIKEADDVVFFQEVMTDWSDISDQDGNVVEFSAGGLRMLLGNKRVRSALTETYMRFFHGKDERARKN